MTMDLSKNCMRCSRYYNCKDPAKSIIYTCGRFIPLKDGNRQEVALLEDLLELPIAMSTSEKSPIIVPTDTIDVDIRKLLKEVISEKRIVSPDIKFPERDFAEAPNFYTWCRSDKYLKQKPFIEQAVIGTKLFAEYCPLCTDMEWFENTHKVNDPLSKFEQKVALLEKGVCPHCSKTRLYLFKKKLINLYTELALSAGQRSGKSALVAMLTSYLTHRFLKLERPAEVFGLLSSTVLQGTFTALTFAQAKDTLWDPFYGNLLESPWFREYHAALEHVGGRHGEELYNLKDSFVVYKHRRLSIYPAGPDKRILRGRTRIFASVDELGWFPNDIESLKNVKMNATEVYIALERSLLTVRAASRNIVKRGFYNVPFAYFINISSPSSVRDKIMELVRKAQNSRKTLGLCKPTWKMNPHVPKSALSEEFRTDPIAAMRDYGAQPPLTNNAFIPNKDNVESCLTGKRNSIEIKYCTHRTASDNIEVYGELKRMRLIAKPCILALDAGYAHNSFAFAIGFLRNAKPVVSIVGEIIPMQGMRINYSRMFKYLITPMFEFCNIVKVVADRWNSLKILSDAEEEQDIEKQVYSLKYSDMQMFKSYIEDGSLELPLCETPLDEILKYDHSLYPDCFKNKPVEHFILQMLTVQDTGSAVIKGDGLTDDINRAVMLLHQQLLHPDNKEILILPDKDMGSGVNISQMAVARNYSGGGSSSNPYGAGTGFSALGGIRQRSN